VTFIDDKKLTVPPLISEEEAWILEFEQVLNRCPERLQLVTSGYRDLDVVDAEGAKSSELSDGAAGRDGVVLARIITSVTIHGVSN
jgi:hypothetical protein